ncbi:DNA-3-methyladenine glycosylase I [Methylomarinum sp. Ch1-1]|uniref:DNA-3-methyladenine glycosylase I n=1 Tax=Methylomarinum roseum TaxID=3067653 RepID=A0AAU7NZ33_9GAMM|nr:DNA-3-methyladenine glycosylase I [Methylomarinum sp. Ch1-1]MDP4521628.1 DNA-3-methyladenine glycosylase I [Methylomarinum sp. Ch1-1]
MHKCAWALASPIEEQYHDREWGVPVHDDRLLFEFLILEGAQAGLSWRTILNKREAYRAALANFDANTIAAYGEESLQQLLQNPGIIRNKMKLRSAINNARCFLEVQQQYGSFDQYIWQFVGGETRQNLLPSLERMPALSPESEQMSRSLKQKGFSFVGPTICYAFMQAVGMVNDHVVACYRHRELSH